MVETRKIQQRRTRRYICGRNQKDTAEKAKKIPTTVVETRKIQQRRPRRHICGRNKKDKAQKAKEIQL